MGRKKIKIARINDDRNRSVTYLKRKAGLMKKAHELAVLTGSEVAVIVFGQNGKLTEFCSGDMDRVLLRYTEHNGPVERKGPEHYSNDDDDASDDDGGDVDDGEGAEGSGAGGAGGAGGAAGIGGPSDQYSPDVSGQNGASEKGQSGDAKNNKRKAPNGHRMKDSISSDHSSKRGSPPHSAPIIKVEGDTDNVAIDGSVKKGALKAAIIQRSISKPGSHDGGSSSRTHSGTHSAKSMSGPDMSTNGGNYLSNMPHRPYTAGAMAEMHPSLAPNILAQQYQRQQASSPHFAFSADQSNMNTNMNASSNPFLRPQAPWGGENGSPQLMRANSGSTISSNDVSYGDLARGGSSQPHSPYKMQHDQSVSPQAPSQSTFNPAQNYASLQLPQQSLGNQSLLPLAHPILRQHPQYEAYTNQLRMQQQQYLASRSGSQPIVSAHTAPSSPNHLVVDDHSGMSSNLSAPSDPTLIRRSASFGYMDPDRREFQQSLSQDQYQFINAFDTPGMPKRATSQQPSQQFSHNVKEYASVGSDGTMAMPPPPPYGHLDAAMADASAQNSSEPSISDAAFNNLMGSILSDMESTANSVSSTTAGGSLGSGDERNKESLREQEEVILSMESDGSLSTLVNNESFDAIMKNGASDESIAGASGQRNEPEGGPAKSLVKSTLD